MRTIAKPIGPPIEDNKIMAANFIKNLNVS